MEQSALEYNTERNELIIPEYGRHIQKMVEQAMKIADRTERNNTAKAIIAVMGNMNPHLRDVPDFQHKLWDQLFKMSDFQIDVDSPLRSQHGSPPPRTHSDCPRLKHRMKYRFYGNNILKMIQICVGWEEGELKEALKFSIANHMKKCFLTWNKEGVEDSIIFAHLYELSNGKIDLGVLEENLTSKPTHYQKKNNNPPAVGKKSYGKGKRK